jgi:cbb3-type cytochrome oxidase subunit 3
MIQSIGTAAMIIGFVLCIATALVLALRAKS